MRDCRGRLGHYQIQLFMAMGPFGSHGLYGVGYQIQLFTGWVLSGCNWVWGGVGYQIQLFIGGSSRGAG